jgi:hypothetical protein
MRIATAAFAALAFSTLAAQAQTTTRIETRPYYGYVVSVDNGVRVWRALPPHDRVIINPEGKTPLTLSFNEHRHTSYNHHTHVYRGEGGGGSSSAAAPTYFYGVPQRAYRRSPGVYVHPGARPVRAFTVPRARPVAKH